MSITRRQFIKNSMLSTAGIAGGLAMSPCLQAMQRYQGIPLPNPQALEPSATICRQCSAHCGIIGYLEGNQLVSIYGNPAHPNSKGKLCARGMAGINLTYDPERVLYPLRRIGRRGEGNWKKISWDEAYQEIARALKKIQNSKEWFVLETAREEILTRRFLRALGVPRIFFSCNQKNMNAEMARMVTLGSDTVIPDVLHSNYILNFGSNLFENHDLYVPLMSRLIEGRIANRAKMVTIDVRLSHTAGLSDEWLPILPGTDGMVALAMGNIIMQKGLFDRTFLKNWTNYSVDKLESYLSAFTPQQAEKISGISADEIKRIAIEFAQTKPAVAISGGGPTGHVNGTQNERCILLLNALVGNIDTKGGCLLPRRLSYKEPAPRPPEAELFENAGTIKQALSRIKKENSKIGLYLCYLANPAYSDPQSNATVELLKDESSVSKVIAVDTHLSETAALADMVLPAAASLESWGIDNSPSLDLTPFLALMQPVLKPLGETEALRSIRTAKLTEPVMRPLGDAVAWGDILLEVANRIGGKMKDFFAFDSVQSFLEETLKQFKELEALGGMDYLQRHGIWVPSREKANYRSYGRKGFKTPSGKLEIYSSRLKTLGFPALPSYEPMLSLKQEEYVLVTFSPNIHALRTSNSKWLAEAAHENSIWINKKTGQSMGIRAGDKIRIESEVGSLIGKVHLTAGIHPRAVAISHGFGHWGYGNISRGKKFESADPDTREVWWRGRGIHPNPIIPVKRDPIGGGQAWNDTRVKISKV